jgi:hypothetical protein
LPNEPHVVIATPCYGGQLTMAYVDSVLKLQAACIARAIRIDFDLRANEALITRARNDLAARFLASSASHLMFIDADIGFAPEQFFRLLDFNAEVTAAAYPLKHIDWDKVRRAAEAKRPDLEGSGLDYVVYFDNHEGTVTARNGFIRVRYAGTGFLLIQRGVLLRLCEAHPELRYRMVQRRADIDRDVPYQYSLFECDRYANGRVSLRGLCLLPALARARRRDLDGRQEQAYPLRRQPLPGQPRSAVR